MKRKKLTRAEARQVFDRLYAQDQAKAEAFLQTEQGERERQARNVEMMERMRKKKNPSHLRKYQFKKGHGKKTGRSSRSVRTPSRSEYVIAAQANGKKMFYDGEKRFTENAKPERYVSQKAALDTAKLLLRRFPKLRRYRVTIEPF